MEKKIIALDTNTIPATVRMRDYDDSLACVKQCIGCDKMFDHEFPTLAGNEPIMTEKCVAYSRPAIMWPKEKQEFAMETVLVRSYNEAGQATGTTPKEVPIIEKYCALASHYTPIDKVKSSKKILVGQQKQGRG